MFSVSDAGWQFHADWSAFRSLMRWRGGCCVHGYQCSPSFMLAGWDGSVRLSSSTLTATVGWEWCGAGLYGVPARSGGIPREGQF
jgi:hypothetical protein